MSIGIKTGKDKLPSIDLSQPKREKGVFSSTHAAHDDSVGFTCHDDYSSSVDIENDQ